MNRPAPDRAANPVPPTKRISQTVAAEVRTFVSVSVIVGVAPCPVPLDVIVHWQVWPVPATADAVAVLPHPPLRANSSFVHTFPRSETIKKERIAPVCP